MGINYYHQSLPCKCCGGIKEKTHIGKSSSGWQFHFRGYRDPLDGNKDILSFDDWIKEFADTTKEIVDEDGKVMSTDDFMTLVIEKKKECLNHYNIVCGVPMNGDEKAYLWTRSHLYPCEGVQNRTWKDDEGYAFTDWEFS
jgi:hypothetical protein